MSEIKCHECNGEGGEYEYEYLGDYPYGEVRHWIDCYTCYGEGYIPNFNNERGEE